MKKKKIAVSSFGGLNEHSEKLGEAIEMVNLVVNDEGRLIKRREMKKLISLRGESVIASWEGTLRGIECILFVTSGGFYKYLADAEAAIYLRPFFGERAELFEFDEKVFILSDVDLYCFDGGIVERVEGYSPVIAINTDSEGGCELYESANMLTPRRRQRFSTDGESKVLRLLEKEVESIFSVKHLGETLNSASYTFDAQASTVTLDTAFPKGENTIEVEYVASACKRAELLGFKRASVFGGGNDTRVFLFGSDDDPSCRRHSEIGGGISRADYFPENNFVSISGKVITSIIRHYDRQLIFCLDSTFYSIDEIRQDSLGGYYHSFPVFALNSEKGHIGDNDAVLIANEPVSVTYDGIYRWVSTSVRDERNAIKISDAVSSIVLRFLGRRDEYRLMLFDDDLNSELWIKSGDEILVYNYGSRVWYFYNGIEFSTFSRHFGKVLLGGSNGDLYCFEEGDGEVAIRYVSGESSLGDETSLKDVGRMVIGAGSKNGASLNIELVGDVGGADATHELTLIGGKESEKFRRRIVFRRTHRLGVSIDGVARDLTVSLMEFEFKERGRLF